MRRYIVLLIFFTFLVTLFCYAAEENTNKKNSDLVTIRGTIERFTLEGGFYGIKGDDGKEYKPIGMSEGFQVEGLRVKVQGRLIKKKLLFNAPYILISIIKIERDSER